MIKYCLLLLLSALLLGGSAGLSAQTTFTAADALRVRSLSNTALSPDGRYLAGLRSEAARNRFGIDHFRFRDPSYLRPADYDSTQRYPLVCEIYEDFFDNGFRPSMNILANQGYFGFRPSVRLEKGRPGVAWVKGVTAGINKLIERGLVDPERIGVHGTSYGGYAASLLIAQTDRFATAINISGKTNMISFLGDSPRIGTRNYAAAEVGQDRIGESLWEAPLKYIEHSAVLYADKVKTPHLLLTGGGDWNVPAANTREMYYALRRLGKKVVWVDYPTAGHGAGWAGTESTYLDQWRRMLDWYAEYLKEEAETDPR